MIGYGAIVLGFVAVYTGLGRMNPPVSSLVLQGYYGWVAVLSVLFLALELHRKTRHHRINDDDDAAFGKQVGTANSHVSVDVNRVHSQVTCSALPHLKSSPALSRREGK